MTRRAEGDPAFAHLVDASVLPWMSPADMLEAQRQLLIDAGYPMTDATAQSPVNEFSVLFAGHEVAVRARGVTSDYPYLDARSSAFGRTPLTNTREQVLGRAVFTWEILLNPDRMYTATRFHEIIDTPLSNSAAQLAWQGLRKWWENRFFCNDRPLVLLGKRKDRYRCQANPALDLRVYTTPDWHTLYGAIAGSTPQ